MTRQAFPKHFGVIDATPIADTHTSHVWRVCLGGGRRAIVKALKPVGIESELAAIRYLAWRDGQGAARLLARNGRTMMLEDAGEMPLSTVIDRDGDAAATDLAADVLARLHARRASPPPPMPGLRRRYAELYSRAEADARAGRASIYREAATLNDVLDRASGAPVALHGDFHHDNVHRGRRGWLAIDPQPVFGDRAYDAANLFYNPLDHTALCLSEARIAAMAAVMARALGIGPRHILDRAFTYGCLSAVWHAGDGNREDEARELSIAQAVRAVSLRL